MGSQALGALVLAAGEGRRLEPLTAEIPKPLLPVLGRSILEHTLDTLVDAGVRTLAINLHHLGERIAERIGPAFRDIPIHYSPEPQLLGTGGALVPLRELLAPADTVVVVNGDSLCRWPLAQVLRQHHKRRPDATLLLSRRADPARYGGGVGVDRDGRVVSLLPGESFGEVRRRRVFAGLHLLHPALLARLPPGPSDSVRDLYRPLLAEGRTLLGVESGRPWLDLGMPGRYLAGVLGAAARSGGNRLQPGGNWVAADARVGRGARLRRVVVEAQAEVASGARLERVLVLPGARVPGDAVLREVIVGPGAELPDGTVIAGQLITRQLPGVLPPVRSSRLAGLVYTPLVP
ncbi:MAG: sugar phosphate nucleotidyltransferase [Thermoanaerobaculia bacterium]